ncbi:MAG: flagellar hook-basal body complex protein FliE [Novosphingobium sp.]|uniref:flagellar hook-basal body complex protein FliE n=1 Tax=Novosphingobium sp. TaxID=1874826 RepID=UPI0012C70C22|nr:flagellar hook-basal body complex protein FliE [Novosphingobium sp.]MPS71255.1 flagellar hook-basal body complex protein FliE [Novosphingobium sp.]
MAIGALDAAAAYGRAMKTAGPSMGGLGDMASAGSGAAGAAGGSFGSMVESMVTDASSSLRTAEAESAKQVAGKGDLIDVVTAMGAAETALDTVVAVRDRVVSAYSEIMRMQI